MGLQYLTDVTTLTVDEQKCTGCGRCLEVCPHAVLARTENRRIRIAQRDQCIECGACVRICEYGVRRVRAGCA